MRDAERRFAEQALRMAATARLLAEDHLRNRRHLVALLVLLLLFAPVWLGYLFAAPETRLEGLFKALDGWAFVTAFYLTGEAVSREARTGRWALLRTAGVPPGTFFVTVSCFWIAVFLGLAWTMGVLLGAALGAGTAAPAGSLAIGILAAPVRYLPLVALCLALGGVLAGWLNVAACLGLLLLALVFDFLADVAGWPSAPVRIIGGLLFARPLLSPAVGGAPVLYADWPWRLARAVAVAIAYLGLGTAAVRWKTGGRGPFLPARGLGNA